MTQDRSLGAACLPVTVAVPTWRRPQWLRKCLNGVLAQTPAAQEVLAVCRPDDADTIAVVEEFGDRVRVVFVEQPGFVAPLRVAIREATAEFLAVIDDDAEPASIDWLNQLFTLNRSPDVACVGSRVINLDDVPRRVRKGAGRISWYGRVAGNASSRTDPVPVDLDTLQECNWMWRLEVLRRLSLAPIWDESDAVMYGFDLCQQARALGRRVVYTSGAPTLHHVAPRGGDDVRRDDRIPRTFFYARNLTYVALKHYRWRLLPFVIWSTLVGDSAYLGVVSSMRALLLRRATLATIGASIRGRVGGVSAWRRERALLAASPTSRDT